MNEGLFSDVTMFWLIHLFLGIVVPFLIYWACCSPAAEDKQQPDVTRREHL